MWRAVMKDSEDRHRSRDRENVQHHQSAKGSQRHHDHYLEMHKENQMDQLRVGDLILLRVFYGAEGNLNPVEDDNFSGGKEGFMAVNGFIGKAQNQNTLQVSCNYAGSNC